MKNDVQSPTSEGYRKCAAMEEGDIEGDQVKCGRVEDASGVRAFIEDLLGNQDVFSKEDIVDQLEAFV